MLAVRGKKGLVCWRIHSITRFHEDLELLVSRWSVESHTFVAAWGKLGLTLEEVLNLMALPLYKEANAMGLILEGEEEDKF